MLENRSFDSMLGWLYEDDTEPINLVPGDSQPPTFDGIANDAINSLHGIHGMPYSPMHGHAELGLQRRRVPRQDPGESMSSVHQQMYAMDNGIPVDPQWASTPRMSGFAFNFQHMHPPALGEVMGAYTAEELPVLHHLAKQFQRRARFSRVVIVNGPRQSGKTVLLRMLHESTGGTWNSFDDANALRAARRDAGGFVRESERPLFVDECSAQGTRSFLR